MSAAEYEYAQPGDDTRCPETHPSHPDYVDDGDRIRALVQSTPIERVIAFAADFWDSHDDGAPPIDEADEATVRAHAIDVILDGLADGCVTPEMVPHLFADFASVEEKYGADAPRFRTSEMEAGDASWTLAEMIAENHNGEADGGDVCAWCRAAKVGDEYRDIVTVTRVS